jgi:hypothetical protein
MPRVVHQEMVQVHQGNHPVDQSDWGMGLLDRLGRRRVDSHQAGTDHVGGSLAAAAAAAVDPVKRHLGEAEIAVPVAHFRVSKCNLVGCVFKKKCSSWVSEGRQRKISTRFCALGGLMGLHPKSITSSASVGRHRGWGLTPMIAGSCGIAGGAFSFADSSMRRSFTSLPRKTICSYTTSDGGYSSFPPLRPSVPNERTLSNDTVEASELISTRVPTYLCQVRQCVQWLLNS